MKVAATVVLNILCSLQTNLHFSRHTHYTRASGRKTLVSKTERKTHAGYITRQTHAANTARDELCNGDLTEGNINSSCANIYHS